MKIFAILIFIANSAYANTNSPQGGQTTVQLCGEILTCSSYRCEHAHDAFANAGNRVEQTAAYVGISEDGLRRLLATGHLSYPDRPIRIRITDQYDMGFHYLAVRGLAFSKSENNYWTPEVAFKYATTDAKEQSKLFTNIRSVDGYVLSLGPNVLPRLVEEQEFNRVSTIHLYEVIGIEPLSDHAFRTLEGLRPK